MECVKCGLNGRELIKQGWLGDSGFEGGVCARCQWWMNSKRMSIEEIVEEKLLKFANLRDEVTTSDLQGLAYVLAREIIELVKRQPKT